MDKMEKTEKIEKTNEQVVTSVWRTFRMVFGIVPLVAGLDKFANLLVHWETYVAPALSRFLPMSTTAFMHLVGGIEIVVGLAVLFTPWARQLGYVVAIWLLGISLNLILAGFLDVAVRDLVMAVSALSFARLGAAVPAPARAHLVPRRHLAAGAVS